jgi:uncharacterized protein with ParB-like and HNH nuclease domain
MNEIKRFSDIVKIKVPTYKVNISVRHLRKSLQDLAGNGTLQMNPPFQRGYKWNDQQKEKYLEYFFKNGPSARDIYFNQAEFGKGIGDLQVIDGKQRLSSFFDFFDGKIKIFEKYFNEFEDQINIADTLIVNVFEFKDERDVIKWYLDTNTGGTYHTDEDLKIAIDYLNTLNDRP